MIPRLSHEQCVLISNEEKECVEVGGGCGAEILSVAPDIFGSDKSGACPHYVSSTIPF